MSRIVKAAPDARTIAFPSMVREVSDDAFDHASVESIVLNEGLEKLGGCRSEDNDYHRGIF